MNATPGSITGSGDTGNSESDIKSTSTVLTGEQSGTDTGVQSGSEASWRNSLPEELQKHPSLQSYKDLPTAIKSFLEQEKLIGKKGIYRPEENASPEDKERFYKELGKPDKPDMYGLKKPEDWPNNIPFSEEESRQTSELFHKAHLSPEQAKILFENLNTFTKERWNNQSSESLSTLQNKWGSKYDANLDAAKRAFKQFGSEDLTLVLEQTGLGNHHAIIEAFSKIGLGIAEDASISGDSPSGFNYSPVQAQDEINKLYADKEFSNSYFDDKNPNHQMAKTKMDRLFQLAYPTPVKSRV